MGHALKKVTVYFKDEVLKALKNESRKSRTSVSQIVNEAISLMIEEDREDSKSARVRARGPFISEKTLLRNLKKAKKI